MSGYALESGVVDAGGRSIITLNGGTDSNNTTVASLGAGGVFTGTGSETSYWASVIITCHVDVASATDGLEVQWSPDNVTWFTSDTFTINANTCKIFTFMPAGRYYRVKYTNGGTPQAAFYLCTQWRSTSVKPSSHRIQDGINEEDDAELVKAVLTAMHTNQTFDNVMMDVHGALNVAIPDGPNLDAFSRLRTSHNQTLFDSTLEYDLSPNFWHDLTSGAASAVTHVANESSATLTCGTESNAYCIRQTKEYFHYQPGKSQLVATSFVFGAAATNVVRRVGYFDDQNGIFLEQTGTDVALVRRTYTSGSAVDNRVVQASWSEDVLDGTGHSAFTLDLSKVQILVIDLQWLGAGRVRVGFDIDGHIVYAHEFRNANTLDKVYMRTASLPVRYEIRNTALQGGNNTMKQICSMVAAEGGLEREFAYTFSANNGTTATAVTTRRAVLSIRPKATFNSIAVRNKIIAEVVNMMAGTNNALYEVVYNPTFSTGGGALTWTSADANSTVEYSVHGDANAGAFTGGMVVQSGYLPSGSGVERISQDRLTVTRFPLVLDSAGANPTSLSIVFTATTGTSNCNAAWNWREIR